MTLKESYRRNLRSSTVARRGIWAPLLVTVSLNIPHIGVSLETEGMIRVAYSARALLVALALATAAVMVGAVITRLLGVEISSSSLSLATWFIAGSTAIGWLLMLMGLLGWFGRAALITVPLGAVWVCWLAGFRPRIGLALRKASGAFRDSRWSSLATAGALIVLLVFLAGVALGPTVTWDVAMYHLDLPAEFVAAERLYLPEDNLHVAFIGTPHMLGSVAIAAGAPEASALIQLWTLALTGLALVSLVGSFFGPRAGRYAIAIPLATPALLLLGPTAMTEAWMVLAVLVVVYWALVDDDPGLPEPWSRSHVLLLALLGASSALVKYQAVPYLLVLVVTALWVQAKKLRRVGMTSWTLAVSVGVGVLAPLILKNTALLGAPFYPFLAEQIFPAWVSDGLLGGNTSGLTGGGGILGQARQPFTFAAWVLDAESLSAEAHGAWYGLPLLFTVGLALPLFDRSRRALALPIVALGGLALIIAVQAHTNPRYLLPAAVLLGVATVPVLVRVVDSVTESSQSVVGALVAVALVLPSIGVMYSVLVSEERFQVGVGLESEMEWAEDQARQGRGTAHRLLQLDRRLQEFMAGSDKALLMYDGRGYSYSVGVIQDNLFQNWSFLREALRGGCLDTSIATHVVWNLDVQNHLIVSGTPPALFEEDAFRDFAARCLDPISAVEGFDIYRVRDNPVYTTSVLSETSRGGLS